MSVFRKDFPAFASDPTLVYLDSASTTQMPECVISAMAQYYGEGRANIHRGVYDLSEKSETLYALSKKSVARWVGSSSAHEITYTANATSAYNLLVRSLILSGKISKGDKVLVGTGDHHASLVPWMMMRDEYGIVLEFLPLSQEGTIDLGHLRHALGDPSVRALSLVHASNVTGALHDLPEIGNLLSSEEVLFIVDASQSVAHVPLLFSQSRADAMIFTGHKLFADTGIGALVMKKELMKGLTSPFSGGGAINFVHEGGYEQAGIPDRFEPGTPHIAGALSLGAAIEYLELKGGFRSIQNHEQTITDTFFATFATRKSHLPVTLLGPKKGTPRVPVWSFHIHTKHPSDVAEVLAAKNICVRVGHHCAEPLAKSLGITASLRVSASIYTSEEDIHAFFEAFENALVC